MDGSIQPLSNIQLAFPPNPEGLLKLGGNLYSVTEASGAEQLGVPGQDGLGVIRQTALEASNVEAITGTDFTIHRKDGIDLDVDVSMAQTIGDVLDLINNHVDNQNPATSVLARLAAFEASLRLATQSFRLSLLNFL